MESMDMFTDQQKAALVERCKAGEGVRDIIQSMGINPDDGIRWLQNHYRSEMKAAKLYQINQKVAG